MQYFSLLIPIIIGYIANDIWSGVVVGSILWLAAGQAGRLRAEARRNHHPDETEKRFQALQSEIDRLKLRLSALEQGGDAAKNQAPPPSLAVFRPAPESSAEGDTAEVEAASAYTSPVSNIPDITRTDGVQTASASLPETERELETRPSEQSASESANVDTAQTHPVYKIISAQQGPSENALPADEGNGFKFSENPIVAWFLRGNPLLKTGIVVLFLGLAFLLRYASERIYVPVEMRYLTVAGAGLAAVIGGWKLQSRKREYGLVLQGFGVAVMYLTALAALKLHPLLPAPIVFLLMVAMVVLMALLAIRQNAQIMAQVALVGGLAAPILVSDGSGNYLVLFSYLSLLNAGVAAIAWFKAWRPLNLTGFAGTFSIAALWGMQSYTPQHFATTEPFLIYHWLLYTFIAYLFARRKLTESREDTLAPVADNATLEEIWNSLCSHGLRVHVLDHTLLFGTMAAAFGLQYRMVEHWPSADAFSALGFAAVYGLAALMLKRQQGLYILRQAFFALSLLFLTLAVPLYFERGNTVILWTVESALVYFFGLRQQRPHMRLGALVVYLLAALIQLSGYQPGESTILQGQWFTTLLTLFGGAAIYLQWHLYRRKGSAQWEQTLQDAALCAALFYTSILPLLFFAERGSIIVFSVLVAAWAFCRGKGKSDVFSTFALGNAIFILIFQASINDEPNGFLTHWHLFAAAPLLFAAAYMLQYARVQTEASENQDKQDQPLPFSRIAGWAILVIALMLGGFATYTQWTGEETLFIELWALPIFTTLLLLANRLNWKELFQTTLAFLPLFALHFIGYHLEHLWTAAAALPLAAATVLNFVILNNRRTNAPIGLHKINIIMLGILWSLWSGMYVGELVDGVWSQLSWLAVPLIMWVVLHTQRQRGFFRRHQAAYQHFALPIAALASASWMIWTNFSTPFQPAPLPYIPLLNPLELACAGMLWFALKSLPEALPAEYRRVNAPGVAALAFMVISAGVMRLWHFYGGITWRLDIMLQSFGLQASLSVVWAVTAIILMVYGNRRKLRPFWITGAALMAIVVVKLFLIELANSGGIARIASFIIVGVLLLLVGWFAPVPPKGDEKEE